MTSRENRPSIFCLLLVSAFALSRCDVASDDALVIQTTKGRVKGVTMKAIEKEVDAFLGIPYAQPPLGERRFHLPQPVERWSGVLDATQLPNTCIQAPFPWFDDPEMEKGFQPNTPLSEDCLALNVWVPRPRPQGAAVMVFIHGGAFASGSPNFPAYDPRVLCAEEKVLVVSIAYRVGALGFLYLDRPEAPGNAGLFDQHMALEWVRDNIRHFGGDPKKVTLFGDGAGAVSISFHLLSPLSQGLFTRAIVLSGSIPSRWLPDNSVIASNGLALVERLKCPRDPESMVACLRAKDPMEIALAEQDIVQGFFTFASLPVVDGHFVPEPIADALTSLHFKNTEFLIGFTSQDANVFVSQFLSDYFGMNKEVRLGRREFMHSVRRLMPALGELVHQAVLYEYADWNDLENSTSNRDDVGEIITDSYLACSAIAFARRYAESGSNIYVYVFDHVPSVKVFPDWMGSVHGYDVPFWLGQALMPELGFNVEEKDFARRIMRYWANFARSGNPNQGPKRSVEPIFWPRHTEGNGEYLTLSSKSSDVGKNYKSRRCAFWQEYVPKLEHYASQSKMKCSTPEESTQEGYSMTTLAKIGVGAFVGLFLFFKLW